MLLKTARIGSLYFALTITLSFAIAGCSGEDKKTTAAPQTATPMKVIKAVARDMPFWGEFVGQINAVETVDVRARVAGFLLEKKFREGATVKKGDLLFIIDPRPLQEDLKQAQSGMEYNQALLKKAKKDFERFKKLYDEGVVSRDEYEGYQTSSETLKAQVRESSAQVENARIQLGYTKIYSPIDGSIGSVQVNIGNLVGQGENTLLVIISTVDPVYVNFSVSESQYIKVMRDLKSNYTSKREVKMILADGQEYEYHGKFDMVDRAVDSRTGTLGIRVIFPNPNRILRPGQYAKVRVLLENQKNAVVIPTRGVMDVQGMKSIFVVGADGTVKSQPIKLGFEVKDLVVVEEGLKPDDMVIVDGIRRVKAGMKIKPIVTPMDGADSKESTGDDSAEKTEEKAG